MTAAIEVLLLPTSLDRARRRARLEDALLAATGAGAIGRLCPRCAAGTHGRPWVRGGEVPTHVSVSYTDGLAVAAWTRLGPIGVDAERASATPAGPYGDLAQWTRAEAVLKATGEGLLRDPCDLPDVWSTPLHGLPEGYVGHVALLVADPDPVVDVRTVLVAAASGDPC